MCYPSHDLSFDCAPLQPGSGALWLGRGDEAGEVVGVVNVRGSPEPLAAVRIIGPGLECVPAVDFGPDPAPSPEDRLRWSRHAGALDEATWLRQRSLRVAVVGVGRMGSVVAATLARWGASVALVDPDRVEAHNLDASEGLLPGDLGRHKTTALAERLRLLGAGGEVEDVPAAADTPAGRLALAECEVAACCVDNDAARRFVGTWARRCGLVLLDLGAGVHRDGTDWRAGADVRLIVPGDGCLECWGGLADPEAREAAADWRRDRAGSLRTLNQTAAHLGLTLLEQILHGRLRGSTWLRLEIGTAGVPAVPPLPRALGACPACDETLGGW